MRIGKGLLGVFCALACISCDDVNHGENRPESDDILTLGVAPAELPILKGKDARQLVAAHPGGNVRGTLSSSLKLEPIKAKAADRAAIHLTWTHYGYTGLEVPVSDGEVSTSVKGIAQNTRPVGTEWLANRVSYLEHGWTVNRPSGVGNEVRLKVDVLGAATVPVKTDTLHLIRDTGSKTTYGPLKVFDANKRALASRFEVTEDGFDIVFNAQKAAFPVVVDPPIYNENFTIEAPDGGANDILGNPKVFMNRFIAATAQNWDGTFSNEGKVYIFERNTGGADNWGLFAELYSPNPHANGRFGYRLEVDEDQGYIAVVERDAIGGPLDEGAIHIFQKDEGGVDNFGRVTTINSPTPVGGDRFGRYIEIYYPLLLTSHLLPSDEAILFEAASPTTWNELTRYPTATSINPGAHFPYKNYLGIRAENTDVELYELTAPGVLTPVQQLVKSGIGFGRDIKMNDESGTLRLITGASAYNSNDGALWVYAWDGMQFVEEKRIDTPDNTIPNFGDPNEISGDTILVQLTDGNGGKGEFYGYRKDQGGTNNWGLVAQYRATDSTVTAPLSNPEILQDIIIGSANVDTGNGTSAGKIYLFANCGTETCDGVDNDCNGQIDDDPAGTLCPAGQACIAGSCAPAPAYCEKNSVEQPGAPLFSDSLDGNNSVLIVAAQNADYMGNGGNGLAWIYERDQGGTNAWGEAAALLPSTLQAGQRFGRSVAVGTDWAIVGSSGFDDTAIDTGRIEAYCRDCGGAGNWGTLATPNLPFTAVGSEAFGTTSSISGNWGAVGTLTEREIYMYEYTGGTLVLQQTIPDPDGIATVWGRLVEVEGDKMVIAGASSGEVRLHTYELSGGTWSLADTTLIAENGGQIKIHISADGSQMAVGVGSADSLEGRVFLYDWAGTTWAQNQVLNKPASLPAGARFGAGVMLDPPFLVGASTIAQQLCEFLETSPGTWTELRCYAPSPGSGVGSFFGRLNDGYWVSNRAYASGEGRAILIGKPTTEICNNVDDDCDAVVDNPPSACGAGYTCHWGTCFPDCTGTVDCAGMDLCYFNDSRCDDENDPCTNITCQTGEVCYQGSCFQGCGTNLDCNPMNELCWDASRCGPDTDPCYDVQCPEGLVCYQGTCFQTCTVDGDCSPPNLCFNGYCAADDCDGIQCPAGEVCSAGACAATCMVDADCPAGEFCVANVCQADPCASVMCPMGEVCYGGSCFNSCMNDGDCTPPESCYAGRCADDACQGVTCPPTQACYGGTCFDTCLDDADCSPPELCFANHCANDACEGVQCGSNQACYEGSCFDTCMNDGDCSPPDVCWDDRCAVDPCDGIVCQSNEICYGGSCFESCTDNGDCTPPDVCYTDHCAADPCDGVACSGSEACYQGSCFETCYDSADCTDPSDQCFDLHCAMDACEGVQCAVGEACYQGTCFETCGTSADCDDPSNVCYSNRCIPPDVDPECYGVVCPSGEACFKGSCFDTCTDVADCDPNHVCYQDVCLADDCSWAGGCGGGETCYNGVCFETCGTDGDCTPPNKCFDGRCAANACEAVADTFIDNYDASLGWRTYGKRLQATQRSLPWLWPRPIKQATAVQDFVDASTGTSMAAVHKPNHARVFIYDDEVAGKYYIWLSHGSAAGSAPANAVYSILSWDEKAEVVFDDDLGEEAFSAAVGSDPWYVQATVTTDANETGGIVLGPLDRDQDWTVQIYGHFTGAIQGWELYDSELADGLPLSTMQGLRIVNRDIESAKVTPEHGRECPTSNLGACRKGTMLECDNGLMRCYETVAIGTELCDAIDNDCDGFTDGDDPDLTYPMVFGRQDGISNYIQLLTYDTTGPVDDVLNYTPHDPTGDDRFGSVQAVRKDGTPLQTSAERTYLMAHRDLDDGHISIPIIHGKRVTDPSADSLRDQTLDWELETRDGATLEEIFISSYDDRPPAASTTRIPDDMRWNEDEMDLKWLIDRNGSGSTASYESDHAAVQFAFRGDPITFTLRWRDSDDDDSGGPFSYRYYSPNLGDIPLAKWTRTRIRVEPVPAANSVCVSNSSLAGCELSRYTCLPGGVTTCQAPDLSVCSSCPDFDGDGFGGYDPSTCPMGDDCDDLNPNIYPGAPEMCNGLDDDCDGLPDIKTDMCPGGATQCGPNECNFNITCRCPEGPELPDDMPSELCVCGESLTE